MVNSDNGVKMQGVQTNVLTLNPGIPSVRTDGVPLVSVITAVPGACDSEGAPGRECLGEKAAMQREMTVRRGWQSKAMKREGNASKKRCF